MKIRILFLLLLSLPFFCINEASAQYKNKNKIELKPSQVRKLPFIQLEKGDKKFPDSYLLGMRDDNLILATDISGWGEKTFYVKSEINLKNYDYLMILDRKRKHKNMAIWGTICGGLGYFIAQKASQPTSYEVRNKTLLGQRTNSGVAEGLIGGITGVGFGILIGSEIAKVRINLSGSNRKTVRKLKEFNFYE